MGFEQLAELRNRLRAQAEQAKPAKPKAATTRRKARESVEPVVEAIRRLQKYFPLVFPVNPAPKVPLKLGILGDAAQHLERLGITHEQLTQAIATWCRGSRYWACLVEDAPRLDLNGEFAGKVTAEQAVRARRQASRRPQGQARSARSKPGRHFKGKPEAAGETP